MFGASGFTNIKYYRAFFVVNERCVEKMEHSAK